MEVLFIKSQECPVCQNMVPRILSEPALSGVITLLDLEADTAKCVELDIRAVPTMIVRNNHGREISRKIGFQSIDGVMGWLLSLGAI